MAKIVCVLYDDPTDGFPTSYARDDLPRIDHYPGGQTLPTPKAIDFTPGDLLGSGTLSGPEPDQAGSLLELTMGGKQPITLPNGERRTFLEDGDTLTLRGWCERAGAVRIGLGEVSGTVLANVP